MVNLNIRDAQCRICGSKDSRFIIKDGEWDIIQCKACSFVYVTPLPTEQFLYLHYQQYLPSENIRIEQWRTMMSDIFLKSLDVIDVRYNYQRGTLLDIGCGYGFFLELARRRGWHVHGIEPCVHARDHAASMAIKIDSESLIEKRYEDEMFDVVTLFYVLEHLPNPLRYLNEINRILKPGGLLLLRVPHTTPIVNFLKIFRISNKLYDIPSHLSDFSPKAIALALSKAGFCEIQTFPGGATRPHPLCERLISVGSGAIADVLYTLSGKRLLLPGVSKTTVARKAGHVDAV